jgi:hypothetical protein
MLPPRAAPGRAGTGPAAGAVVRGDVALTAADRGDGALAVVVVGIARGGGVTGSGIVETGSVDRRTGALGAFGRTGGASGRDVVGLGAVGASERAVDAVDAVVDAEGAGTGDEAVTGGVVAGRVATAGWPGVGAPAMATPAGHCRA